MAACQPLQGKELQPYDDCDPSLFGGPVLLPRQASSAPPAVRVAPPEMSSSSGSGRSATEARALKIHSEAERRRRERINAHLATLRSMIPDTTRQMDKATLLARVVEQVKLLKREASEATTQSTTLPPETDEVSIELNTGADRVIYIRASISCDDRPDLVAGLAQAFHGLRLRTVRADMTSLGGRARHVFVLCKCKEEGWGSGSAGPSASLRSLKEAVRQALARVASPETAYGSRPFQSKRHRILESHYSIMSI
ncbi:putative transcription factor bHLH107 isoform X2 [Miscanthus floridulus]|uniref:putative transcription factor bHLH107 isoform X2 n=1 Tax=Miscanthus floridulus TaxID=154761 RepID=UPI003458FE78